MQEFNSLEERKFDQIMHERINKVMDEHFIKKEKQDEHTLIVTKKV
jgi:hypothetical protein